MDEIPRILDEYLKQEDDFLKDHLPLFSSYIPYFLELQGFLDEMVRINNRMDKNPFWRNVLNAFLIEIEDAGYTGFTTLMRGHPKQALACFRPALETAGYVWHIFGDPERLQLWWDTNKEIAKTGKRGRFKKRFWETFENPRFPVDLNEPLYALDKAFKLYSQLGSHIRVSGMSITDVFVDDPTILTLIANSYLAAFRDVCAVMGEVCTKSFPSPQWGKLNLGILRKAANFGREKALEWIKTKLSAVVGTSAKIYVRSRSFRKRASDAIAGLDEPMSNVLIAWIKSKPWKQKRVDKVIEIVHEKLEELPRFPPTVSPFLQEFNEFPISESN